MGTAFYEEIIQLILDKRVNRKKIIEEMEEGINKEIAREMERVIQFQEDQGIAVLRGI